MRGKSRFIKALTSIMLAIAMAVVIMPAMPASAAAQSVAGTSFNFSKNGGGQGNFAGNNGKAKVVVIGAISNDDDTNLAIEDISDIIKGSNAMDNVEVFGFYIKNDVVASTTAISNWVSSNDISSKIVIANDYNEIWGKSQFRTVKRAISETAGVSDSQTKMPLIGYIDTAGNIVAATVDGQNTESIAANLKKIGVNIDVNVSTVTVKVTGNVDTKAAYSMLDSVNNKRNASGKSPLKMSQSLFESAKQRAAELSVLYNDKGVRPDGTAVATLNSKIAAENVTYFKVGNMKYNDIAKKAMDIFGSYTELTDRYMGSYDCTGMSVFINNGMAYCVQQFGTTGEKGYTQPANEDGKTFSVKVTSSDLNLSPNKKEVYCLVGGTVDLRVHNTQASSNLVSEIDPACMYWKLENGGKKYAELTNGTVKGVAAGDTYVYASLVDSNNKAIQTTFLVHVVTEMPKGDGLNTYENGLGWLTTNGVSYWYEGGVKQGTMADPKNVIGDGTPRGREIYDPVTNGWYWLDSNRDGARAINKEVWMPYIYQDEKKWSEAEIKNNAAASGSMSAQLERDIKAHTGKWVRYDANGAMIKGWYTVDGDDVALYPTQAGNTYYYDYKTGLMAKGVTVIDGVEHEFDEITGVLVR